jgi:peptide/nickel transport system substrate-binding protein
MATALPTRRGLALAACAMVVAAACGSSITATPSPTPSATPTAPPPTAAPGNSLSPSASAIDAQLFGDDYAPRMPASTVPTGTLVVGEVGAPTTLDPWSSNSQAAIDALRPAMRGFVAITSEGRYIPDLTTTVPTPANGGVVVNGTALDVKVTLKPNLRWSDGTPLTMDDFAATWKWATGSQGTACPLCAIGWPDIGSIDESSDRLTATIHFKDLYSGWLGFLTNGPWPATYLTSAPAGGLYPLSDAIADVPMDGPFTITKASAQEIDYAPDQDWAGGVSSAHVPYLASLRLVFYTDRTSEINDFLAGHIDLALSLTESDYRAVAAVSPAVGKATSDPLWQYEHLDLNNDPTHARRQDLWDPAVRQALAMAIDKPGLIDVLFPGQSVQPACSPAPPSLWYGVTETCPTFDPAAAQAALKAAGLTLGTSGDFQYAGKDLDLEMCTTAGVPARLTELQAIQRDLAAVHVKSYIKTVPAETVLFGPWARTTAATDCSIFRGTYDVAAFAYALTGSPYNDYDFVYSSAQWPEKGDHSGNNDTRFSDPAMDAALSNLKSAVDLHAQADAAKAVQDAYVAGMPEIPLYYRTATTGVGAHAGNWPGYAPSAAGALWNVEDWFYQ